MKILEKDTQKLHIVSDLLQAMGHPIRLKILTGLCDTECNVNRLWQKLNISQPLASQHLNRMRRAGLVIGERRGQQICYRIADKKYKTIIKQLCEIVDSKSF